MKPSTATKPPEAPVGETPPSSPRRWSQVVARFGLLIAWAAVFLVFSVLPKTADIFPTIDNIATILGSQAVIAVLTRRS